MKKTLEVKVDRKVKPIYHTERKPVKLVIGKDYFVSFGSNVAKKCKLVDINKESGTITMEIPIEPISEKGYTDQNGNISHHRVSTNILSPDEIGLTPEEAVVNQVTF